MRKALLINSILSFTLIISLISCKKDEKTTINSIKYNDKEAEIGTALGFAYGQTEVSGVYYVAVEFFEKSINVVYSNGLPDSINGNGDALLLTFLTNNVSQITAGEYTLKLASDASKAFTIDGQETTGLVVGFDDSSNIDPPYIDISGGKVTVAKNGDEYEFTFNLKTYINSTITGYYKGKPVVYSSAKKKSMAAQPLFPRK